MARLFITTLLTIIGIAACGSPPPQGDSNNYTYTKNRGTPGVTAAPESAGGPRIAPVFDPNNPAPRGTTLLPLLDPNKCVDIPYGGSAANNPVQLWRCDGDPATQSWTWVGGQLRTRSNQCLDVLGDDPAKASQVVLSNCNLAYARPEQLWVYDSGMLQIAGTNRCVATDRDATQGTPLRLRDCSRDDIAQQWGLGNGDGAVMRGTSLTTGLDATKCIDVVSGGTANGTALEIYTCNYLPWQQFTLEGRLLRVLDKCLQAAGEDSLAELDACTGAPTQQWQYSRGQLQMVGTSKCLTLPGANLTDGTRLKLTECAGKPEQQWAWGL